MSRGRNAYEARKNSSNSRRDVVIERVETVDKARVSSLAVLTEFLGIDGMPHTVDRFTLGRRRQRNADLAAPTAAGIGARSGHG
jgi:hypothetical protein